MDAFLNSARFAIIGAIDDIAIVIVTEEEVVNGVVVATIIRTVSCPIGELVPPKEGGTIVEAMVMAVVLIITTSVTAGFLIC